MMERDGGVRLELKEGIFERIVREVSDKEERMVMGAKGMTCELKSKVPLNTIFEKSLLKSRLRNCVELGIRKDLKSITNSLVMKVPAELRLSRLSKLIFGYELKNVKNHSGELIAVDDRMERLLKGE
jgi:predicted HAD superfamily phosphohydrolase